MTIDLNGVREFMRWAHEGQFRNDGKTPYSVHPERVLEIAESIYGLTDAEIVNELEFKAACLSHDLREDCAEKGVTFELLEEKFGPKVVSYIRPVTKPPLPEQIAILKGDERMKAKLAFNLIHYFPLGRASVPRASQIIKMADRLHNLSDPAEWEPAFKRYYLSDTANLLLAMTGVKGIQHVRRRFKVIIDDHGTSPEIV